MAIHESGHALVAALSEHADPVAKITILPAGQTLGVTEQLPLGAWTSPIDKRLSKWGWPGTGGCRLAEVPGSGRRCLVPCGL